MRQKLDFVTSALTEDVNFTELCAEYGISRKKPDTSGWRDTKLMADGV